MTLQNRVWPTGEIVADPTRGLFMGNRGGRLHNERKELGGKRWVTWSWITCRLAFAGYRRDVMGAGYTELFFLDEAVALAAGHRPCAECRREDYETFRSLWKRAFGSQVSAREMDATLQEDRVEKATKAQKRYRAKLADLPDGVFVLLDDRPFLVRRADLLPFERGCYGSPRDRTGESTVTVLTPRCSVEVLRSGYRPILHSSAA